MAKNKKSVQVGVFNILKSVMDAKAKSLKQLIERGEHAAHEEIVINERISNLYKYISANRYDRETVRDAEYDIAEYEAEAAAIRQHVIRGIQAKKDMQYVNQFNKTYNLIINGDKIKDLQASRRILEDKIAKLDDRIFACYVNMNPDERDAETVAQAEDDIVYYENKYQDLIEQRTTIDRRIADLQNQK